MFWEYFDVDWYPGVFALAVVMAIPLVLLQHLYGYISVPGPGCVMTDLSVTVLGIVRRDDEFLVQRLTDPGDGPFYRPIGGGVEFRETSGQALEREFREELDVAVEAGPTLGTLENLFTWNGEPRHELVVCRAAEFADVTLYERERFEGVDAGGAVEYEATWRALDDLAAGDEPFYPEGLMKLLRGDAGAGHGHAVVPGR